MAKTLAAGVHLKIDAGTHWRPDDALFDLLRERPVVNAMLGEVAGRTVADANLAGKVKVQKQIIRDCLDGKRSTTAEGWLPGWMAFPVRTVTESGTRGTAEEWALVRGLFENA